MRTWISFRTGIRGVRVGASLPNPAARIYQVSAAGRKVWNIGSAVMLVGLVIWLIASRDQDGRLSENFLLVIGLVLCCRYLFKRAVVAYLWKRCWIFLFQQLAMQCSLRHLTSKEFGPAIYCGDDIFLRSRHTYRSSGIVSSA